MTNTRSLCPTCYLEIPATTFDRDGAVWMAKTCPAHGDTEVMLDPSAAFWAAAQQPPGTHPDIAVFNNVTLISITEHCNLACHHCHRSPDNTTTDDATDFVVSQALGVPTPMVCLMGAEPTMRRDLPEIVTRVIAGGKWPLIYTNGIKLADPEYFEEMHASGLRLISVSIHETQGPTVIKKAHKACLDATAAGWKLGNVSFTVSDVSTIEGILEQIVALSSQGAAPRKFVIRGAARIGRAPSEDHSPYLSHMINEVAEACQRRGYSIHLPHGFGNNPYRVILTINGIEVAVVRWPTVETIDMKWMNHRGPWTTFVPSSLTTAALGMIIRDGMMKGWYQGMRLSAGDRS